jgi:hypothetical protein
MKNRNFETLRNRNRLTRRTISGESANTVGRMILNDIKAAVQASNFAGEQVPSRIHVVIDEGELPIANDILLKSKTGLAR